MQYTLAVSDSHWGGPDHLMQSRDSIVNRAVEVIETRSQGERYPLKVVNDGDMVVGQGIWRTQNWEQLMPNAAWQSYGWAWIWRGIQERLQTVADVEQIAVVKGNHDRTGTGACLAMDLALKLNLFGIPAKFVGSETLVNLAPEGAAPYWCLFEHGYGHSAYYPLSYTLLRNTEKKLLMYTGMGKIIPRACFGHSHWLFLGYALNPFNHLDCLGGMQRNDRPGIGRGVRASGAILYAHDGERLEVIPIEPEREALMADLGDGHLEIHCRQEIAQVMDQVLYWLEEHGYVEPDVIAGAMDPRMMEGAT